MQDATDQKVDPQKDHSSNAQDPRHIRRVSFMQRMFAYTFMPNDETKADFLRKNSDLAECIAGLEVLDQKIQAAATERPLAQVNKVDLAILRTIMFEWERSHTPVKVLINEGVEIAKEFGTESSPKFVNGVLAKLLTEHTTVEVTEPALKIQTEG
ncbi:hypothetical protein BH10PAT2_BH10PAT2_2900 [soil metagenome]